MAKPKPLTLDPARLLVLAKSRDIRRALVRDLASQYQDQRELLADVRRQSALARETATWEHGDSKGVALEKASRLEARTEQIRADMAATQREIDLRGAEAAQAAQLLAKCLMVAKVDGLTIPRELVAEAAERISMGVA